MNVKGKLGEGEREWERLLGEVKGEKGKRRGKGKDRYSFNRRERRRRGMRKKRELKE